jgi:hypothetical protein
MEQFLEHPCTERPQNRPNSIELGERQPEWSLSLPLASGAGQSVRLDSRRLEDALDYESLYVSMMLLRLAKFCDSVKRSDPQMIQRIATKAQGNAVEPAVAARTA